MVVAIIGLSATIMLMVILRFTTRMESIEFLTDSDLTKLMGNIDLDDIYKVDGIMEGFKDIPLEMISENENILIHVVNPEDKSKLSKSGSDYKLQLNLKPIFFLRFGICY